MESIQLSPPAMPFRATVRIPGSKSITNRALPLAALAAGTTTLRDVLFADDTRQMIGALQTLGYGLLVDEPNRTVRITGLGSAIPATNATLTCGNSGTTIRFLAALCAIGEGRYTLDGVARMRQRPIGQLTDQLRTLGKRVTYDSAEGYPPVTLDGPRLGGGTVQFKDAASSQYISAILLAAPYARAPITVELLGRVTSEPYVAMTLRMMEQFGIVVQREVVSAELTRLIVPLGQYQAREYGIEPDASNASYFLAAAAVTPGASVTVEGLGKASLQGDVAVADVLHQMGAGLTFGRDFVTITGADRLRGITLNMNAIPDMVQTIAVVALFAEGPTTLGDVANLRVKETDRLAALETELRKLGATVSTTADSITIHPPAAAALRPAVIATYDDHRMAMAFAVAGVRIAGITILDPGCTAKTYPEFFADLAKLLR